MVEVTVERNTIAGIVLAGGQSRRLGGAKALLQLGPKPLLAHVIARAEPQVASLALSVNANLPSFQSSGLPLLVDSVPGFERPLARIVAGLDWAARQGSQRHALFPARYGGAFRGSARRRQCWDCLHGFGRPYASGLCTVAGIVARRVAPCSTGAGSAQGRCLAAHYRSAAVSFAIVLFNPFLINASADQAKADPLLAMVRPFDNRNPGV